MWIRRSVRRVPVDAVVLVNEALKRVSGSRSELARRLGLHSYGEDRLGRWLRGEAKPRYDETIALLELVGWLNRARAAKAEALAAQDAGEHLQSGRRQQPQAKPATE